MDAAHRPLPLLPSPGTQEELVSNTELVQSYRQQISNVVNQANLQLFWILSQWISAVVCIRITCKVCEDLDIQIQTVGGGA